MHYEFNLVRDRDVSKWLPASLILAIKVISSYVSEQGARGGND
jgi:hypothetical protein